MRICLCVPPNEYIEKMYTPPLGLGYIASVLKNNGIEVEIIDSTLEKLDMKTFIKRIKHLQPDIAGVTCNTSSRFQSFQSVRKLKELGIITVLGGCHVTFTDVDTMKHVPTDFIIRGEGEHTFLDLVKTLEKEGDVKKVKGITFKNSEKIIRTEDRPFCDIDNLPLPDRDMLKNDEHHAKLEGEYKTEATGIMLSRGCPNKCVFCVNNKMWKRTHRLRDYRKVADEIELLLNDYEALDIWDNTLNVNLIWLKKFCNEILNRRLKFKWYGRARINNLNTETLKLLKKTGCVSLGMGIESGSNRILKVIKKGITVEQSKRVVKAVAKTGITGKYGFMFSHPTETVRDLLMTFKMRKFVKEYGIAGWAFTTIYPGTDLETIAKQSNLFPLNSWSEYYHEKRNILVSADCSVPLFEQIRIETVFKFMLKHMPKRVIKYSLRNLIGV